MTVIERAGRSKKAGEGRGRRAREKAWTGREPGRGKGDGGPGRERNRPPDRKFRNFLRGSGKNHTTQFDEFCHRKSCQFFLMRLVVF